MIQYGLLLVMPQKKYPQAKKIFIAKIFLLCSKDRRNFSEFIMLFRVGTKNKKTQKYFYQISIYLLWTAKICKFLEKRS